MINTAADTLHGDLSQSQRDDVMFKFRNKGVKILVATDVAARGIDINNLTHIINYNLLMMMKFMCIEVVELEEQVKKVFL